MLYMMKEEMSINRNNLFNVWLALTLSVLFFHPLFATLHDNVIILQWRIQNSLELLATLALCTLLLTGALWLIDKATNIKIRLVLLILLFIVPFVSFFVHFMQQLGFKGNLITLGQSVHQNRLFVVTIGLFCGSLFFLLVARYPRRITHALIVILLTLSPLNALAGWTLWNLRDKDTKIMIKSHALYEKKTMPPKHNLIVFLFDELSFEYLYKDGSINPLYVNFRRLSSISDNYHAANSPGGKTITAIPGMLMGRRYKNIVMKYDKMQMVAKDNKEENLKIESDNLFAVAKANGYKTFAYGSYLPYCEMFDRSLDVCRSFSLYNYATAETQFSLLNPIMTTFMIWPQQKPQGLIKNKIASQYQRRQIEQVFQITLTTLDEKEPIFLFSHIDIPHFPFVFNRHGYYKNSTAFLQNDENYQKQLEYVDYLLGELLRRMMRNEVFESSNIIVLADHNYRAMFPSSRNHIPLIFKKPYQQTKRDIFDPVNAENILRKSLM